MSMETGDALFRKTGNYRVLIDPYGTGHIRIIKRVNFRTIILVFWDVYREIRKNPGTRPHIIICLSRSLSDDMSDTITTFLSFSRACIEGSFELRII